MNRLAGFYRTTIGRKVFMAVTGALMFVFLIAHLAGNLLVFAGPKVLNDYAGFLKHAIPEVLWPLRIVLFLGLVLHIIASAQVTWTNWRARPTGYATKRNVETNIAARTMFIGGPLILAYVIYHLAMFTYLKTGPGYSETDVYRNMVLAFRVPLISGIYICAMIALGFHLYHGVWSMFQTLGVELSRARRWLPWIVAIGIAGGFILVPFAVLAGIVGRGV